MNWDMLDKDLNLEEVKAKMEEKSEFEPLPDGDYEVAIDSMELGESKAHDPMLRVTFKVVAGQYENRLLFMNKVMQPQSQYMGFQVKQVIEFLNSLEVGEYDFTGFAQLDKDIKNISKTIEQENVEYLVRQKTKKDYANYEIKEVYKD